MSDGQQKIVGTWKLVSVMYEDQATKALTPIMGALICLIQMAGLPLITWARLLIWLVIGLAIYFGYGVRKSRLAAS